ncbi:MAG: glycoside hydrolase family 28 protein, partial [Chitinophagaceae bacterium]|nr:glycoside hydrolase family 28 protein [Chitinophagaceae bacterium]
MKYLPGLLLIIICSCFFPVIRAQDTFDHRDRIWYVSDFGAKGDGETINTTFIQQTIDACSAAGGGTVKITAGHYLSGTLFLK